MTDTDDHTTTLTGTPDPDETDDPMGYECDHCNAIWYCNTAPISESLARTAGRVHVMLAHNIDTGDATDHISPAPTEDSND